MSGHDARKKVTLTSLLAMQALLAESGNTGNTFKEWWSLPKRAKTVLLEANVRIAQQKTAPRMQEEGQEQRCVNWCASLSIQMCVMYCFVCELVCIVKLSNVCDAFFRV